MDAEWVARWHHRCPLDYVQAMIIKANGRTGWLRRAVDMRQRAYDSMKLLRAGKHHNPELQAAFAAAASEGPFEIIAVESLRCTKLLSSFKQCYIERAGRNCFNRKNGIPTCRARWT